MSLEIIQDDGSSAYLATANGIARYAMDTGLTLHFGHPAEGQPRRYDASGRFQPTIPTEPLSAPSQDELALKAAAVGVAVAKQTDSYYNKHFRARDENEIMIRERYTKRAYVVGTGFLGALAIEAFTPSSHATLDVETLTAFGALASFWTGRFGYGTVKRGLVKRGLEADPNTKEHTARNEAIRTHAFDRHGSK